MAIALRGMLSANRARIHLSALSGCLRHGGNHHDSAQCDAGTTAKQELESNAYVLASINDNDALEDEC